MDIDAVDDNNMPPLEGPDESSKEFDNHPDCDLQDNNSKEDYEYKS